MKNNRLSRFAIPYVIWMALFVVAPIIMVVIYAFSTADGGATLANFAKMGTYTVVFTRSFKLALIATAICLLIGYPVSYVMSKEGPRFQRLEGECFRRKTFPAVCRRLQSSAGAAAGAAVAESDPGCAVLPFLPGTAEFSPDVRELGISGVPGLSGLGR